MYMLSAKLTKKSNNMNEYLIKSYHEIYVDDYNKGELDYVNGYDLSYFIKSDSVADAIQQYIENKLYYTFDAKVFMEGDYESNVCHYSVLVDEANEEANEHEYELWKQGKIKLYTDNIRVEVYTVTPVVL